MRGWQQGCQVNGFRVSEGQNKLASGPMPQQCSFTTSQVKAAPSWLPVKTRKQTTVHSFIASCLLPIRFLSVSYSLPIRFLKLPEQAALSCRC